MLNIKEDAEKYGTKVIYITKNGKRTGAWKLKIKYPPVGVFVIPEEHSKL